MNTTEVKRDKQEMGSFIQLITKVPAYPHLLLYEKMFKLWQYKRAITNNVKINSQANCSI